MSRTPPPESKKDWASASESADYRAPMSEVFEFLADPTNDPLWMPRIGRSAKQTDGPIGEGTVFQQTATFLGRRVQGEWKIVNFSPDLGLIDVVSISGPFDFTAGYRCVEIPIGTRVTKMASIYLPKMFPFMSKTIAEAILSVEFKNALRRLKDHLEPR